MSLLEVCDFDRAHEAVHSSVECTDGSLTVHSSRCSTISFQHNPAIFALIKISLF